MLCNFAEFDKGFDDMVEKRMI